MPYAVQPGDIVVPSYWPNSGWSPWHENPAFEVAELPRGSLMFQALERYINGNIQARSFRAKKAERTRMQRAEAIVQDTSGAFQPMPRRLSIVSEPVTPSKYSRNPNAPRFIR